MNIRKTFFLNGHKLLYPITSKFGFKRMKPKKHYHLADLIYTTKEERALYIMRSFLFSGKSLEELGHYNNSTLRKIIKTMGKDNKIIDLYIYGSTRQYLNNLLISFLVEKNIKII